MKNYTAPDLGIAFKPSKEELNKLTQDKASVIEKWIDDNDYQLVDPNKSELKYYLTMRMREQGRFAGLKVKKGSDVYFLKFPLGGKTAQTAAYREYQIYRFIDKSRCQLPISKKHRSFKTPFGYGLALDFIDGERLENVSKSDKIEAVAELIHKIQTVPISHNSYLFGNGTNPIHSWADYYREVDARIKKYRSGKPARLDKNLADRIYKRVEELRPYIIKYENQPVFSHRDFFDKNIIVATLTTNYYLPTTLFLVDFEHAALVKNYLLGLNFDLANIVVQWYRYPHLGSKLISLVRKKNSDKRTFDLSLTACLIIQILAKIDYTAQQMTPGGRKENLTLLRKMLSLPHGF